MNYNVVLENKLGEAVYRYIYTDESGYTTAVDVMKWKGVIIFNLDDVHLALGYSSISKRIYSKLDKHYIFSKYIPGKDPRTSDFTDIANLEIFIKYSRKFEAKKFLKWVKEVIMLETIMMEEKMKDHLEKVFPKKDIKEDDNDEEIDIDIESLTDDILSREEIRKAIMDVLKSRLKSLLK